MNLIQVFQDTRDKSHNEYREETMCAIADAFVVKHPEKIKLDNKVNKYMDISFINDGTIETAQKFKYDKMAVLNFADALVPGGLVLSGERTQEENICRCSNLYETLVVNKKDYYDYNISFGNSIYSNRIIYSFGIKVFKDGKTYDDIRPFYTDVITCPAPSCSVDSKIIFDRIDCIVRVAARMHINTLILGAWGCGAFGQDPVVVSKGFAKALVKYPFFKKVVFAIRPTEGHSDNTTFDIFKKSFWEEYNNDKS